MTKDLPPSPEALSREKLLAIILTCERRFAEYVGYHMMKSLPDYEKAKSNLEFAEICARARIAEGGGS